MAVVAQLRGAKVDKYEPTFLDNGEIASEAFLDVQQSLGVKNYIMTLMHEGPAILDRFRKLLKKGKKP